MFSFLWHGWFKGHNITTNRGITVGMMDSSRGWLHKCECGKTWAR